MKKLIAIIAALLLAVSVFGACSKQSTGDVSMYDLNKAMCDATDKFTDMKYVSSSDSDADELFTNISDMDYSKVKGFFITYASNGTGNADEIAVIQVKSKNDLQTARDTLNAHLERRKALYATYDKSQSSKLEKGVVITYGDVAALIVGDDVSSIKDAFYNYFK
jgi:hypothetical protein